MQLTEKHHEYWRRNLRITALLLFIWFVVTYVMAWFAIPLASITMPGGWPLSFYMAAQGSLVIYVLIIWYYARKMRELDLEYGVDEGDE
jgi:putative solute:sodium symporter small subunit